MSNKILFKWAVVIIAFFGSVYLLYPVYDWYSKTNDERNQLEARGERPGNILNLGLDLRGGSSLLLELDTSKLADNVTLNDAMAQAIEIIRNRIDQYGVAETPINRQGDKWISVQLPGIANPAAAEALIGKTAQLKFMIVKTDTKGAEKAITKLEATANPWDDDGNLIPEIAKLLPAGMVILKNKDGGYSVLDSEVKVTGADLENANVNVSGDYGMPEVTFSFNIDGANKFGALTGANIGKQLAIVLDNTVQSAPTIQSRITKDGRITGRYTLDEAKRLAITLRAGALPAPVKIIEKRVIGPSLGEDSIKSGISASLYGLILILLFMLVYYRGGGLIADIALLLNLFFLLALMAAFNSTLTLPGIAGIILALAMAIDANVLILERMREEKHRGLPADEVISNGYDKAWSAIIDSHVTNWIAALFLFQFGSGPVKGFAVTLTLGLVVSLFTSVFVTRAIYDLILTSNPKEIGKGMMNFLPKLPNIDFLKFRKVFFAISACLILAAIGSIVTRGFNFAIDFKGGTMVQVSFKEAVTIAQLRNAIDKYNPEIQSFVGKNTFAIKIKGSQDNVNDVKDEIEASLKKANLDYKIESTSYVGPAVGQDLSKKAVWALVLSLLFIILYVAFRFQNIVWGTSGVIALAHDAIFMLGVFSVLHLEFDLVIVAAILTVVGYSINDNIVIFDRMRENIHLNPKMPFYEIVNLSINETLSRTIITSGTVLVAVIILYFFGGEVLKNFSLSMIVGVIIGTYSTIAIATPLVYHWVHGSDNTSGAGVQAQAQAQNKLTKKEIKKNKYRNN